ncbi:MAG TPA: dipeptidase [Allosphingosinicella sp.]|nr:dipeptidase [Allosphingosinicella sp.]
MRLNLLLSLPLLFAVPASAQDIVSPADRLLHEQMLTLDSHLDTPVLFERPGWDFDEWHNVFWDGSQVDIPRMEVSGLDGGFFVIYTGQGPLTSEGYAAARERALLRAAAIQRVVAANGDKLAFATTADDAERLHREGKRIVYQAIENSYPLGTDVSLLSTFYRMGVRMAGPVHNGSNQFADSARPRPGDPVHKGLSALGRRWVAEMNRLGMVIDGSHSSDTAIEQMIALSKTPIVLSHHGPKAMFDHPRNIDDALMRRLARSGGVMQMNTLFLVKTDSSEARDAIEERQKNWETLSAAERRQLVADRTAVYAREPFAFADFDTFMRSLLHAVRVMGVDHVGIGADWDGGGGLTDMPDITLLPRITARLRREGFSDADIEKIWSGNVLRLLRQAEAHAQRSSASPSGS